MSACFHFCGLKSCLGLEFRVGVWVYGLKVWSIALGPMVSCL